MESVPADNRDWLISVIDVFNRVTGLSGRSLDGLVTTGLFIGRRRMVGVQTLTFQAYCVSGGAAGRARHAGVITVFL